jgi:hypothetical protein
MNKSELVLLIKETLLESKNSNNITKNCIEKIQIEIDQCFEDLANSELTISDIKYENLITAAQKQLDLVFDILNQIH